MQLKELKTNSISTFRFYHCVAFNIEAKIEYILAIILMLRTK